MISKIGAKTLLLFLLNLYFVLPNLSFAEDENPYQNLTPVEASGIVSRLIVNSALVEKFSPERKEQLTSAEVFEKAILDQQKELLTRRNISQSASLKKVVALLYPTDSELRKKFDEFNIFSERLEYLVATGNVASLIEIRKNGGLNTDEKELLDKSLIGFIGSAIGEKISLKKSSEALNYLILLPEGLWISEGKSLATQVFAGMVKDESNLTSEQIVQFSSRLISLFESDPTLKLAVLGVFESSTLTASDRHDNAETLKLLGQIRKFYENKLPPSFVEDLLLNHEGGIDSETSAQLIYELKQRDELSTKFKLKLMWDGYFGPLVPILIGMTIFFVALSVLIYIFVILRRKLESVKIENPFKSKKPLPGYMRPIQVESRDNEDEYTRLLALFDLSDNASENDIKKAYRLRMKALHPDSGNAEQALENSEEFRELKHGYDRIIEIRSAWFKGRKNKK